jgi:hypothetical protein
MGVLKMAGCLARIVCVEAEIPIERGLVPRLRFQRALLALCVSLEQGRLEITAKAAVQQAEAAKRSFWRLP